MNWSSVSACLAWHWPDHHWQCNWRVAWTSWRMCAGKRRTLRATIVTMFSHVTRDVSVFVKCDTIFRLFFSENYHKIRTSKFRKVVRQHTEGWCKVLHKFCRKFTYISNSERIWKCVKNWQSYHHAYWCATFLGHSVECRGLVERSWICMIC